MKYQIISADCHVDADFLPADLFTSRVASKLHEQVPHVVEGDDGPIWVAGDVKLGAFGPRMIQKKMDLGQRGRAMAAAGFDAETCRPTDPHRRIEDQDRDGVSAEVLYGPLRRWRYLAGLDPEAEAETVRAYNEWLAAFCAAYPDRLLGLGGTPAENLDTIVKELEHIADLGLAGAEVPFRYEPDKQIHDPYWEPLWEAATDFDVPVHIHISAPVAGGPPTLTNRAVWLSTAPMELNRHLASVVFSGALERHPTLTVILAEGGVGWIPYLLERMDYEWDNADGWKELCKSRPSELFARQMHGTFGEDAVGASLAHLYPDNFMFGSDYPHPDGLWPDSQEKIEETMGSLDSELRDKLIRGNAAALYGIG